MRFFAKDDCLCTLHKSFPNSHVALLRSFKYHSIAWSSLIGSIAEENCFIGLCPDLHPAQLMNATTGVTDTTANVLHFVLTSNPIVFESVTLLDSVSNHKVIYPFIGLSMFSPKTQQKYILLYDKAKSEQSNLELPMFYHDCALRIANHGMEDSWNHA